MTLGQFKNLTRLIFDGKLREAGQLVYSVVQSLVDASQTHPDPVQRYKVRLVAFNYAAWLDMYSLCPDFSWTKYCGESGCFLVQAWRDYDFDSGECH